MSELKCWSASASIWLYTCRYISKYIVFQDTGIVYWGFGWFYDDFICCPLSACCLAGHFIFCKKILWEFPTFVKLNKLLWPDISLRLPPQLEMKVFCILTALLWLYPRTGFSQTFSFLSVLSSPLDIEISSTIAATAGNNLIGNIGTFLALFRTCCVPLLVNTLTAACSILMAARNGNSFSYAKS